MLVINSIGEPVEFCSASVDKPDDVLWRTDDRQRRSSAALIRSLFEGCQTQPRLVLALADEVDGRVLRVDVQPVVATARVSQAHIPEEGEEEAATPEGPHLIWTVAKPEDGSPERLLVNRLITNDLLFEPFERALAGLNEDRNAVRSIPASANR